MSMEEVLPQTQAFQLRKLRKAQNFIFGSGPRKVVRRRKAFVRMATPFRIRVSVTRGWPGMTAKSKPLELRAGRTGLFRRVLREVSRDVTVD